MIPVMQAGLFFQQAQTIRNLLAAAPGVPENSNLTDADRQAIPLTASARKFISSTMSTTLNLVSEMERIANALGTEEGGAMKISLSTVAEKIARNLGVKTDEVAILAVSNRWRHLHFLVPEALKNVGFVPLSSNSALSARTARESRPEIENNFASARHATVFESIKIGSEPVEAIQKMISAPILLDGKVIGVIQVSRKGANPHSAGPDFTADDLGKILALCKPLGKFLRHVAGE
jgi:hypothetical protein